MWLLVLALRRVGMVREQAVCGLSASTATRPTLLKMISNQRARAMHAPPDCMFEEHQAEWACAGAGTRRTGYFAEMDIAENMTDGELFEDEAALMAACREHKEDATNKLYMGVAFFEGDGFVAGGVDAELRDEVLLVARIHQWPVNFRTQLVPVAWGTC